MLNLPDLCFPSPDVIGTSCYVLSHPLDNLRIHCFMTDDGQPTSIGLFIGMNLFRIEHTKGF